MTTERDAIDHIVEQWARERPDLDSDPMAVIGRINRYHRIMTAQMRDYFATRGLDNSEFDVLATLRRSGAPYELSAGALLRWAMVTSGAITNRIDRLAGKGLVDRRPDPDDRRSVLVRLTPQGKALIDDVVAGHVANEERMISVLDAGERAQLNALMRKLLVAGGDTTLG